MTMATTTPSTAYGAPLQDSLDVDNFLRTGVDLGGNMGVSSQVSSEKESERDSISRTSRLDDFVNYHMHIPCLMAIVHPPYPPSPLLCSLTHMSICTYNRLENRDH